MSLINLMLAHLGGSGMVVRRLEFEVLQQHNPTDNLIYARTKFILTFF